MQDHDSVLATHRPVLLVEATAALNVQPDGFYVDATVGRGGHAQAIVERLGPAGRLLALDRDPEAVLAVRKRFAGDARVVVEQGPFSTLGERARSRDMMGRLGGILLDLGVSSPQLEDPRRGFSFARPGPLDMRMDPQQGISAAEWLATAAEAEIAAIISRYGEDRYARRIAKAIVTARAAQPLATTERLAAVIAAAVPSREPGKHPATRSFQAIRIHINRELEELDAILPECVEALAPGGRLVVISFHSLEDRRVKRFMRDEARGDDFPPELPVAAVQLHRRLRLVGGATRASATEVDGNPRARSAVMRVAERLV